MDTKKHFRLRTYDSNEPGTKCTIWQACRATTAAPTFFKYAEYGEPIPARYVDGGLGMNNSIRALVDEASRIWGPADQSCIGCVLSIDTGVKPKGGGTKRQIRREISLQPCKFSKFVCKVVARKSARDFVQKYRGH